MKNPRSIAALGALAVLLYLPPSVQADPMRDLNLINQSNAALAQNQSEAAMQFASQITDASLRTAAVGNAMLGAMNNGQLAIARQGLPMIDDQQLKDAWLGNLAAASLNAADCRGATEMIGQIIDTNLKSVWEMNLKLRCK